MNRKLIHTIKPMMSSRAYDIYNSIYDEIAIKTDRMFMYLFIFQWLVGILFAVVLSPKTWVGNQSLVHLHVYAAVILGGTIAAAPITLILMQPGKVLNRQVVAVSQILFSVLLIHLTGGRIETHFHVFGSLAFLAFYRDWRVVLTATLITAADHLLRGYYWPESVYGVLTTTPWRAFEHAGWVLFEDSILFYSIKNALSELRAVADKQAQLEETVDSVERRVFERTESLRKETRFVRLLQEVTFAANEALTTKELIQTTLRLVCEGLDFPVAHFFLGAEHHSKDLVTSGIWHDNGRLDISSLKTATEKINVAKETGLAGRVLVEQKATWLHINTPNARALGRAEAIEKSGIKVGLAIPVFFKEKSQKETVIGAILEFFTDSDIDVDAQLLGIADSIGVQLGRVVERVHSQELLAKRAHELYESQKTIKEQEHALVAAAKTSALGEMAGQAAHEINTPLGAIVLTAESMKRKIDTNDLNGNYLIQQLDLILKVTQKVSRIINSMRKLAGQGGNELIGDALLKTLVEDTVLLCEGRFKKSGILFEVKIEDVESKNVQCRPSEVSQVLINLLNNSYDAVSSHKDKWISLTASEVRGRLRISVMDSGAGISQKDRPRLFQPNFTTKSLNQGTGFGLSISRKIVERHKGRLYLDVNSPNTCFVIDLPWTQDEALGDMVKTA